MVNYFIYIGTFDKHKPLPTLTLILLTMPLAGVYQTMSNQILPKGLTGQEKEWDLVSILMTADGISSQYHQSSVSAHHSGAFTPFKTVACCAPANALDRIMA